MFTPEERQKLKDAGLEGGTNTPTISLSERLGLKKEEEPSTLSKVGESAKELFTPTIETGKGALKGAGSTIYGAGQLGEKILRGTAGKAVEAITGKPLEKPTYKEEKPAILQPEGGYQELGYGAEQIAEFAIPGSATYKATKGLPFLSKILARGITSGGVATIQAGEVGKETAIAAGTEAVLPIAGKAIKPVLNVAGRLVKSIASGLSGVSSKAIDAMIKEPRVAGKIAKDIDLSGQTNIITKNAETIINGVSKIRQEARKAYGEAIGALKAEDIKPKVFRDSISPILTKIGAVLQGGKQILKNVEFSESKNLKTASNLLNKLSSTPLNGLSLRNLLNDIDGKAYKIATTDERLSFNAFIHQLSNGVKKAISQSTDKLDDINKAYSADLQLTEGIEGIFGKVKFKSLNEIRKVSEKLESLFSKKGLSPEIIDNFLTKIGVKPSEFKASEAVRQITDVGEIANTKGLNFSEVIRGITSSIITPKTVRDVSILTGIAKENLSPILDKLNPITRGALIELLTISQNEGSNTTENPTD